jgi:signal transduction histidine kinase
MRENQPLLRNAGLVPFFTLALALGLALSVLGAAIVVGTVRLHRTLCDQMVNRDGEILNAVALARQFSAGGETNLAARLQNPADQLALVLNISQIMDGVLAVRLFDADGKFVTAFPPEVADGLLDRRTVSELEQLHAVSHYRPDGSLAGVFFPGTAAATTNATPLIEVNVPIHARGQNQLIAAAQLILDAQNLQHEMSALDENLERQAWLAFAVGGGLLAAVFGWAWRRLRTSNQLLLERTARLLRANHELSLAAKTGALGAVTAHLVHDLSNPLANLQTFVAAHRGSGVDGEEWQDLVAATQRMQHTVQEVVRVLGEENGADNYEITFNELAGILSGKIRSAAQAAGVHCEVSSRTDGCLANRHANLVLLILENLARNALQVTPAGRTVKVLFAPGPDGVMCRVTDEGPGFPAELRDRLFTPCRSTKGGNGIGLAISHQLAWQMGAQLNLVKTDSGGCVFQLTLPAALLTATLTTA